jgi:MFS family permease
MSQDTAITTAMKPTSVVRTYLVISGLFTLSASVIWGVNTLFLLDAGLDIFEVFVANAAFTAGMVIFEIPTGVVADTSGRRRSFLLSAVTLLVGTLGYVAIAAVAVGCCCSWSRRSCSGWASASTQGRWRRGWSTR